MPKSLRGLGNPLPNCLACMQVKYDTFVTVYMSDCDFYPRVRAAGFETLNVANTCPDINISVRCFRPGHKIAAEVVAVILTVLLTALAKVARGGMPAKFFRVALNFMLDRCPPTSCHWLQTVVALLRTAVATREECMQRYSCGSQSMHAYEASCNSKMTDGDMMLWRRPAV